jgi:ferric-dicitrate binding protein FerR (iron transport regulator)
VRVEDLIAYLDGECAPEELDEIEHGLLLDPAALALLRRLCRQRLMLAEVLRAESPRSETASVQAPAPRPPFRLKWQVAAAVLFFAASVTALWLGPRRAQDSDPQVLRGKAVVDGTEVRTLPTGVLAEFPGDSGAEIAMGDGSTVALLPSSRVIFHGASGQVRQRVELRRGGGRFGLRTGTGEFRVETALGTITARETEFSVELIPRRNKGGRSMESLLALVVSVLVGNVQVDVAGKTQLLAAGESRAFAADGTAANTLSDLLAVQAQDGDKKEGDEGKEKKGKKKKEKKEDGDEKEEKNGKDNENKGKNKDKDNDGGDKEDGPKKK